MKAILTLTLGEHQDLVVCSALATFSALLQPGLEVTVRGEGGTLLLGGTVDLVLPSISHSRPSLEVIIDVKPSTSCEFSATRAEQGQSDGTSYTSPSCTHDPNTCKVAFCGWAKIGECQGENFLQH